MTDIHGCATLLEQMLKVIDADLARSRPLQHFEIFLGDYIDRGPNTRGTIDLLVERAQKGNADFLKGNHEALLLDLFRNPARLPEWLEHGGLQTLVSYGIIPSRNPGPDEQIELLERLLMAMPRPHLQFLDCLELTFTCGDFFFVHAGVRPNVSLDRQSESDLLWIRDDFLKADFSFEKFIVHGHTPVTSAQRLTNRINIDTGAYATGNLTLLSIQGSNMLAV